MPTKGTKLLRSGLTDEEYEYVSTVLDVEQRRAALLEAAVREDDGTHRDPPPANTITQFAGRGLPCAIRADTPTGICGKPATIAYAWEQELEGPWPTPGLYTILPVCASCAKKAAEVYGEA